VNSRPTRFGGVRPFVLWLILLGVVCEAATGSFTARVIATTDGDTITVLDANGATETIRIDGIDCPESGQPFGGVARRFTRAEVFDQTIQVRPMTRDSHGRLVARVTARGKDLSVELVSAGMCWHYTDYSKDVHLAAAERYARSAGRGLWADPNPVPPWVWRRQSALAHASEGRPDDVAGPFYGNTSTRVFHAAKCRNAHCKNCGAIFQTSNAAVAAGYRAAGDCLR
jgi:micrococcal nuclease